MSRVPSGRVAFGGWDAKVEALAGADVTLGHVDLTPEPAISLPLDFQQGIAVQGRAEQR